eukprot:TRINITY_DN1154_c0_g1_i2.p1 TRINITY_DN1154_c0_g1~~TRINITY_DN1154_c0_g1_i2.p1  ORF type:complete len:294 (-),score=52.12 TRINITY_DN1154_c0_g1_i2:797-1678(-)
MAEEAFFQGSINDAINKSQIERKLFVVSLQDESNASKQLDSVTWADAQVKTVLRNDCIAIRLVKGTQQAEQFIQIYNPTQCPSIYFLAQGFPFLIIPGFVSPSEFIQKFQGVQLAFSSALTSSSGSSNMGTTNSMSTSSMPVATSSTSNSNNTNHAARTSSEPKSGTNASNNTGTTKPVPTIHNNNKTAEDLDDEEEARELIMKQYKKVPKSGDANAESKPLTQEEIDEQVKKYEEKLKEIRARKAKEKEEEERNKELERIKSAKEMQAAKAKIEEIKRQKEIEKVPKNSYHR